MRSRDPQREPELSDRKDIRFVNLSFQVNGSITENRNKKFTMYFFTFNIKR